MSPNDENKKAANDLAAEKEKFGFGPIKKGRDEGENSDLDDNQDMGDLEDENEDEDEEVDKSNDEGDEDESDEESDEDDDESDDDDEDEEEDEEPNRKKKKVIPFKKYNELRKDLRKVTADLKEQIDNNKKLAAQMPDDFQERVDELIKDVGVADPEGLKKIIAFIQETVVAKNNEKLETKLAELEERVGKNTPEIVDEFPNEWKTFENDFFVKEFPNATPDQIKSAKKVMEKLSHTKGVGGIEYTDPKTGKKALNPYPLDYIFYKNKKDFESVVTIKKSKGMETPRTRDIITKDDDGEIKHLKKDASANDVRNLDKKYSRIESGSFDGIRTPEDNSI